MCFKVSFFVGFITLAFVHSSSIYLVATVTCTDCHSLFLVLNYIQGALRARDTDRKLDHQVGCRGRCAMLHRAGAQADGARLVCTHISTQGVFGKQALRAKI